MHFAFNWDSRYELGIREMDFHHRKLFALIKELEIVLNEGRESEVLGDLLERLTEYMKFHFEAEERLMLLNAFPGLSNHRDFHEEFIRDIVGIGDRFGNGDDTVGAKLLGVLNHWAVNHILFEDRGYADFLHKKGVE